MNLQKASAPDVEILPRATWAGSLAPTAPLEAERPEDVRFLLVHHSASTNDYGPDDVAATLRSFYGMHTGPDKGWPDIAYNFLIDRFGRIWEGRSGSIDAPIKGDATGGSQGYAQLCCFIGDHQTAAPTADAQSAMVSLLAHLAARYRIDPAPGATTTFTSRGSNRWRPGASVTTATIAGHRDMSATECPGDAAYRWVQDDLTALVTARLAAAAAPTISTTTTTTPSTTTTTTAIDPSSTNPTAGTTAPPTAGNDPADPAGSSNDHWKLPAIGTVAIAAVAGAVAIRRRRR